jgi:HEAT repeats
MIKRRFLFLLAISVSIWSHDFPTLTMVNAQTPPRLQTQSTVTYDQLMKSGYDATAQKNYALALEKFQQALAQRPQDPYASGAIANVQNYLGQTPSPQNAPVAKTEALPIPLIAGSALLSLALLGALLSLFFQYRPKGKSSKRAKKIHIDNSTTPIKNFFGENGNSFNSDATGGTSDINNGAETEDFEPSLPVQATSRIPNVDLILRLIDSLRDGDPRTRRRAIWKLAQMSDSRAMQPLVDSMVDGDSYERSLTLEALAQICTRSLRPMNQALAISLQDKNPQVRKNAIRDLTRLYDIMSQISQLICHALDDSDEEVQETARWAIRQLNLQLPPRLDIGPLETTGEPEDDDVQDTSYTESTEVQN